MPCRILQISFKTPCSVLSYITSIIINCDHTAYSVWEAGTDFVSSTYVSRYALDSKIEQKSAFVPSSIVALQPLSGVQVAESVTSAVTASRKTAKNLYVFFIWSPVQNHVVASYNCIGSVSLSSKLLPAIWWLACISIPWHTYNSSERKNRKVYIKVRVQQNIMWTNTSAHYTMSHVTKPCKPIYS